MDQIHSSSLDWALTHITRFGDTDLFPLPLEFSAIRHAWSWLRPSLESTDLKKYRTRARTRMLVPKPGGGFRVATQLDPLDAIVYAALVYEAAPRIEAGRIPRSRSIVFSYRVEADSKGQLFAIDGGWADYQAKSTELASSDEFKYVLLADLADFYNQIYHHRVSNALEAAGIPSERSQNVEAFLSSLTAKQSRGLPVGPSASIVLAEASLTDVDDFLPGWECRSFGS